MTTLTGAKASVPDCLRLTCSLLVPDDSSRMSDGHPDAEVDARRYRTMLLSRRFEQTVQEQFDEGNVPGPLHLSIGQEAVAVGVCDGLRASDVITSTHRGHHHCIAKGIGVDRMMAELLGRRDGYSHGRGGSMHLAVPEIGLLGTNGVVGGGIPIATGAAFGLQVQRRDDVAVCFFGEGAAATGGFSEALNIASLWKLPLIFVCENNQYVELTPQDLHVAGEIRVRAEGYGMPGVRTDGNDVRAVAAVVAEAVRRARAGDGPTLIEAVTYRWYGHYAGDKAAYREEDEVTAWHEQDAVALARTYLDSDRAAALDDEVGQQIQSALAFAQQSPVVGPDVIALDHLAAA
jgi:acetoin:2,6-dichlorophenolindophenol oxidoreductase subunit alpha